MQFQRPCPHISLNISLAEILDSYLTLSIDKSESYLAKRLQRGYRRITKYYLSCSVSKSGTDLSACASKAGLLPPA